MQSPAHYCIFGNPVAHSLSPQIHHLFAKQSAQNIFYEKILVPLDKFIDAVKEFQIHQGAGANITLPFKQEAWRIVDERSSRAEIAGAVNTLLFRQDNSIFGDNTDGVGLVNDLQKNIGFSIQKKCILILGAGGATKGILLPIIQNNPKKIILANRTLSKAVALSENFSSQGNIIVKDFSDLNESFDLIINATSASVYNEIPPVPKDIFTPFTLCYDLFYQSSSTPFLQFAKDCGVTKLYDGLGMLVEQAAESFYLWRGVMPNTQQVLQDLQKMMISKKV